MNRYPYGLSIKEIGLITYNKEIYVLSPIVFWHITANQYNIKRQSNHYDIFASNVWDRFIFVIIIYLAIKLLLFFPLLSRSMMTARPLWLPNGQYKNSMSWMMSIEVYRASSSSLAAPPSRPRPFVSKTIFIPQSVCAVPGTNPGCFTWSAFTISLLQDWICNNNYQMVIKTNNLYFLFKQISSLQIALLLQPFCRLLPGCDIFFYS